ncbi:MAG: 3-hydroxybutyryl-CoA dehydrogenase [Anaerolineales bacterium]|nr:3-hydroxybutyryl-CoA dehydrogenase [Anaerolineales bacterium]
MDIKHIFVVGAGTMGNGIAQTAAVSGYRVTMMDVAEEQVQRGKAAIDKSAAKLAEKGKLTAEQQAAAGAITTTTELVGVAEADLVIEAATENPELKFKLFQDLDEVAKPGVILASNTSSISITKLAAGTGRPGEVIGMHFFNPVPLMTLLEVVRGSATADATVSAILEVGAQMGKTAVVVKDSPGFISNRILCPMINEAILAFEEGIADAEGIDTIMRLGMAHPMGPLALADLIGLDVVLFIMEVLHRDFADDKYKPAELLRQMVAAGELGRKSGKGFYSY